MKQIVLFLVVLPLFVACSPVVTPENTSTEVNVQEISQTAIISQPTLTTVPPQTSQPTTIPALTATPDIVALRTQGVNEPWITATLGTRISPPWYSQTVSFSPDNKLLVSSYGNNISLWQVGSYKNLFNFSVLNEHYRIDRFAFSSDSRWLAATTTYYNDPKSHLFVWDTSNMEEIFSIDLEPAILDKNKDYPLSYPAVAVAFIPSTTRLVAANGNAIQVIDIKDTSNRATINLGEGIYASDISFPSDGRFIYVFMKWNKDNGITSYPPRYQTKYVFQIWDTKAHFLWRTLEYLEPGWDWPTSKKLHDSYLVINDAIKGTLELMDLENEKIQNLPYRQGWSYITTDNKYILFSRYAGVYPNAERVIELWTTDSWKMLYTFRPDYYRHSDGFQSGSYPGEIAISNDISLLAIAHAGQVIIYNIGVFTVP